MVTSPAVRRLLDTLAVESGAKNIGPHGLASIGFAKGVAVVPQAIAAAVLLGRWEQEGRR